MKNAPGKIFLALKILDPSRGAHNLPPHQMIDDLELIFKNAKKEFE